MSADQKKTDIYVACFHSQPGQDLRNASGQFEIVEKAIQSGEWPYDNGDDPSFAEPEEITWRLVRDSQPMAGGRDDV
jgi:hypothetical protein